METLDKKEKNTHHGHAVKRFRHTLGKKQEALAIELGMSQAMVSMYESKKVIEDDMIEKFAEVLGVAPQLIKDLEEDPVTLIFENNHNNEKLNQAYFIEDHSSNQFNPVDKIVELCEKLLEKEQEKIALLEKLLKERN
ncbi:helix-turn-helix protein [Dysgonomonas alginatilytica]|uniref:Helix-turn-helix protein n=1 Tax=Dysgonomonas alginatilytica TaxID=1605892 RepID=A0A2V3PVA6_9BACT|nr:helix-turn-helix transcriptional regulator [Dysgonomonas alginatilytica]PXV68028.1 helix-turn-helix protein [Dysgonomonas alginatilytica]